MCIRDSSRITQQSGSFETYYSHLSSYSEIRLQLGSGQFLSYASHYSSRAIITNTQAPRVRTFFDSVSSRAEVVYNSSVAADTYYNNINSFARLLVQGNSTLVYTNTIQAQSTFTVNGGNHFRNNFSGLSRVTTAFNTRSIYGHGSWTQTLTAANTNRGRDYFNNSLI